jgi:uncharacterized protein
MRSSWAVAQLRDSLAAVPAAPEQVSLRIRMRSALLVAMKARDAPAMSALRSALAAIDNAGAVDLSHAPQPEGGGPVHGATIRLGAGDVARRHLSELRIAEIVRGEVAERRSAAAECDRLGAHDLVARLHAEIAVLCQHLGDTQAE